MEAESELFSERQFPGVQGNSRIEGLLSICQKRLYSLLTEVQEETIADEKERTCLAKD